jgi:hypothetical protein
VDADLFPFSFSHGRYESGCIEGSQSMSERQCHTKNLERVISGSGSMRSPSQCLFALFPRLENHAQSPTTCAVGSKQRTSPRYFTSPYLKSRTGLMRTMILSACRLTTKVFSSKLGFFGNVLRRPSICDNSLARCGLHGRMFRLACLDSSPGRYRQ